MKAFFIFFILSTLLGVRVSAQSYTCSASEPCEIGCCGTGGYCGYGPTFCGAGNCTSSCDAKSNCDPGWGSEWSAAEKCPLNVCCSEYGFCGTTSDFCGNKTVTSPSCSGTSASDGRTVGYYEGWSMSRACDQMYPEGIPTSGYTHLNFAFAYVDPTSFAIAPMAETDVDLYPRFTALKTSNPGLQTWISVGGWAMNDADQPTASTFSDLAASDSAQKSFFSSLLKFMSTYGFDGVDIDWEYPGASDRSGRSEDFQNYVSFLKNLKNALGSAGHNYGLSITLPSSYWYMQNFDIVNIEPHIDFFNLMTYDLHGTWDSTDPYIGAIVNSHTNLTEIDESLKLLWRNGIDSSKVNMGLGFYGFCGAHTTHSRSFTLSDPSCDTAGCPFSGGGNPGQCTAASGILANPEIENIIASGATVTLNKAAGVKEVVWDNNQWVSYDDTETFKLKTDFANSRCLGGFLVWASSLDSDNGTSASALGSTTGLSVRKLSVGSVAKSSLSSCVWGECNADCPSGTTPVQSGKGKSKINTGIYSGCSSGQRNYCCPSDDVPSCTWRGTAPFCNGKCHSGEVQVSSDLSGSGAECWTGHKVLCCTSTSSDQATDDCTWRGSAPFCAGVRGKASCDSGETRLTYDSDGAGGEQFCYTGFKSLCCTSPVPYTNCDWYGRNGLSLKLQLKCTGSCPAGKYPIAADPSWCEIGTNQFCCDVPTSLDDPTLADFKSKLQAWAAAPTCAPKTVTKRSSLSLSDQATFFNELTALFRSGAQSSLQVAEEQLYTSLLQDTLGASPSDFQQYYAAFPGVDQTILTSEAFCSGEKVGDVISDQNATASDLCVLPTDVNPTGCGSLGKSHSNMRRELLKNKRVISPAHQDVEGPGDRPSIGLLMRAVMNGDMTFQYVNLVRISDSSAAEDVITGPTNSQQGVLEVAWLMAPDNDPTQIDDRWQQFGGTDLTTRPAPDSFFVMHFHIDHLLYDDTTRDWYAGAYAYNAFHGQYINSADRVDGNSVRASTSQRNERTSLVTCPGYAGPAPLNANLYMYPGWNVDSSNVESQFLGYLQEQGIFDRTGVLSQILGTEADTMYGVCHFFDWEQLPGGTSGSQDLNGNPYQRPSGF